MYRVFIRIAATLLVLVIGLTVIRSKFPIIIMDLPEGELEWSTVRPKNAKMCVPAAFTDLEGNVEGEYRLNGNVYNSNKRLKVSIGDGTFYIDRKWRTNTGFQQLSLVFNDNARTFRDRRKFIRRALCKEGGKVFLAQSHRRMTLTEFAAECAKISSNAVYLDMGEYGYGFIGSRVLSPWAYFSRNKQTNWIYIK
jgi:hypothetical protein